MLKIISIKVNNKKPELFTKKNQGEGTYQTRNFPPATKE